ncbi:expressed unknown protein [Seminavis robusta]|uniref:Uncharacterized protein n=1 Tax=Seminavis robusta TaxID=568900 RepID=A0A9N8H663_9STRA|nr:expressed unknown protein [Seminavis robusta]|eukprot:Sro136_g064010.1 n/a (333) ;mRNA; r:29840-30838
MKLALTSFVLQSLASFLLLATTHFVVPVHSIQDFVPSGIDDQLKHQLDHGDELVAKFTSEETAAFNGRLLNEDEERLHRRYYERCGDEKPCFPGLECRDSGTVGKRCMPTAACLQEHLVPFQEKFNMDTLKEAVFSEPGMSMRDFIATARNASGGEELATSSSTKNIMSAVRTTIQNSGMRDEFLSVVNKCFFVPENLVATNETESSNKQDEGAAYVGYILEAGLVGQTSLTVLSGCDSTDSSDQATFTRFCLGAGLVLGGEFQFLIGAAMGTIGDVACLSLVGDADFSPGYSFGVAGGIGFNGVSFVEYGLWGGGLGIGAAANLCATIRCA